MLKDFKKRGVPIDGVGLQMHISRLDYDTESVAANIERLTKLGLQVHITELDVSLPVDSQSKAQKEDIQRQVEVYRGVMRACLRNPGCTAIQTWGFTDKYSWIGSHMGHVVRHCCSTEDTSQNQLTTRCYRKSADTNRPNDATGHASWPAVLHL